MSSDRGGLRSRKARKVPLYRTIAGLIRDPLKTFEEIGRESNGEIVRLNLGPFRPYLLTNPEHVQHVLRDRTDNYVRQGMMWKPFRRLVGDGIAGEGAQWNVRRRFLQPFFSGKHISSVTGQMAQAIVEAVDELGRRADERRPVDASLEMTRIVHRAVIRVFFGDRISAADADRLGSAIATAFTALGFRMLLPFVPHAIPLPGDRAFKRAVRVVDEVMFPIVRAARHEATGGTDVVSALCRAVDEDGGQLSDRQVRDDLVAMFVAGSESTALALTWLWVLLDAHPEVAAKLYDEVEQVVGTDRPDRRHLADLRYTKMVLQELLRIYAVGWLVPRRAVAADVVDGVPIERGATVLISPYLTNRMESLWDRPDVFDPDRFSPEHAQPRHRFSYLTFGGGPHQCLGSHFFTIEAQLIVATLLARYRVELYRSEPVEARAVLTVQPRRPVELILRRTGRA
jgi:cytochrome P450